MKPGDTVYVTKYALTQGIVKTTIRSVSTDGSWIGVIGLGNGMYARYVHTTLAEAEKHALVLRDKKIASLQKQIAKLQAFQPKVRE